MVIVSCMFIGASVGLCGRNLPDDVRAVQGRLNDLLPLQRRRLAVSGRVDRATVSLILEFQVVVLSMARPTGLIGPMDDTLVAMNDPASALRWGDASTCARYVPKVQSDAIALPWVEAMQSVLGLHEIRDKDALSKWLRSDGKALGDPEELPWCGDAVDTAITLALPSEPRPGALGKNPYWARNWNEFGVSCLPCYGAVAVFKREGGGHVGFLVGADTTHYHVLGGNQGHTVSVARIDKKRCIGTRWPSTTTAKQSPLPAMSSKSAGVSVNEA